MEPVKGIIDIVLHIDKYLSVVIQDFGNWSYLLLFLIVFAETGFVVTPFLPGDSLLFAVGAFAAIGSFDLAWLFAILIGAAIIGDSVNYAMGKYFGEKAFKKENSRFFKKKYLERTHRFYQKHGGKTIILARFIPIIRTFAPFVAGVGNMDYRYFIVYNITGGVLWVSLFLLCGYYFGNIPAIKNNFSIAVFVIIALSILPIAIEMLRHRKCKDA